MAPVPQEHVEVVVNEPAAEDGLAPDDIVISGMSGLFPNCYNVTEFAENLYNKVNMSTMEKPHWEYQHPESPKFVGNAPDLETFDAQFFKVSRKQALTMDAQSRKILEHSYQALYDAGIPSNELRGKKIGVFTGSALSDYEKACFYVPTRISSFGIAGCNRSMFANRVSYWLDVKGPSFAIDAACSSSMVALERAYDSMKCGTCEAAIVGGTNLCFHPHVSVHYHRLGNLCEDGKTRSFDQDASGTVRADSINCLILQRAKDAKRVYAQLKHMKSQYNAEKDINAMEIKYGPARPVQSIVNFWDRFYREANVSPKDVEYVEAHGSAISEADRAELEAIGQVFCKGKDKPLPVGSVMSNMGHAEAASGICAVTKVLLAYHTGKIASNLHYEKPHDDIEAIRDGRVQVVTEHQPFNRTYVAVNSFSLGGIDSHALLYGYYKKKDLEKYKTDVPRLVNISARTESGVKKIINHLKSKPIDAEEIRLLHSIHKHDIQGHMARGYTILSPNEQGQTVSLAESCDYYPDIKRPVWFVYSGMGSQWAGMGAQLMRIPIFAAAIEKCRKVLEPKGIDLMQILTDPDKTIYDNILNSFVGIAAVQIGLTDILRELGIVPDNIIGHSVGELGCAYADGCFTAEEMILAAYSRGLVSVQTPFIRGSMAAIGLGYKDIVNICPPEIEVACHNGPESSTISGPAEAMRTFVQQLSAKGIFAKEVPCSNIAYHSRYIAEAGPALLKYLTEVIKEPKPRSERWVSTSVPQDQWDEPSAKYSSAEYHTNNLLKSVLFEETAQLIPSNAILIEIAPHGLLQAILKRSLHSNCIHVPLTRRGHADAVTFFLENIGKLYQVGLNLEVHVLYPKVEFPVSTGTPMLSHLVEWMHSEKWPLPKYAPLNYRKGGKCNYLVSIHDEEHKCIQGNVRNGVVVYPEAGMLLLVWKTLAMMNGQNFNEFPVRFQNLQFDCDVIVSPDEVLYLEVAIQKGSKRFEVTYQGSSAVSGNVQKLEKDFTIKQSIETHVEDELTSSEIYKLFHVKGYNHNGSFKSIKKSNSSFTKSEMVWNNDWVTFIDSLLQLNILRRGHDGVSKVKYIRKITINPKKHQMANIIQAENQTCIEAEVTNCNTQTKCGGVVLEDITFNDFSQPQELTVVKRREFLPYHPVGDFDVNTALHVFLQIVAENSRDGMVNALELVKNNENLFGDLINSISNELFNINVDYKPTPAENIFNSFTVKDSNLLIGQNIFAEEKVLQVLSKSINKHAFILSTEISGAKVKNSQFVEVAAMNTPIGRLVLAKLRQAKEFHEHISFIATQQEVANFSFLEHTRNNLLPIQRLVVIADIPPPQGLIGLIRQWKTAPVKNNINLIITDTRTDTKCNLTEQLSKDLAVNIYQRGSWGSNYYMPSKQDEVASGLVKLHCAVPGDIQSLTWMEVPEQVPTNDTVKVHYAGLSHYDVLKATGRISSIAEKNTYGMDFSGVTSSGQRVMGMVASGALATVVEPDLELLWPVPEHWTLEDAATVPQPYVLAFYCLVIKRNLRRGDTILIHSGAGALGQAAISIALALECEVFTTVSHSSKKRFLKKLFPELREDHIGCSRNLSFEDMVKVHTKGYGCFTVINCLTGQLREASMRCTSYRGWLIEVSPKDCLENTDFGMFHLSGQKAFTTINIPQIFKTEDVHTKKILRHLISTGIAAGYVRPLTRVTLDSCEAPRAARLIATGNHRGRVLVRPDDCPIQPRITLPSTGSFAVISGNHELGLELAERLIKRGAKNLLVHYNQAVDAGYLKLKLKSWENLDANVKLSSIDLQQYNNSLEYLKKCADLGPIEGIFIVDRKNNNITEESVVKNLDKAARKICPLLKRFVVLRPEIEEEESTAQRVCNDRTLQNMSALYLNIPTLGKFGENSELTQTIGNALDALETCLRMNYRDAITNALKKPQECKLVEKIGNILGINIAELPNDTTLKDLEVGFDVAEEIRNLLETRYNFSCSRQRVSELTVGRLKEVQLKILSSVGEAPSKLHVYFRNVDLDELYAAAELLVMDTLVYEPEIRNDEFESKETYLMLIPGMEGHYSVFSRLYERLKIHALALQPGVDHPRETVQHTAERFVAKLRKMVEFNGKFYLLGYSFGALIALEMAALLEKEGLEGTVFCVDSAPDVFRTQLDATLGPMSDAELQNAVVDHMYTLMVGEPSHELSDRLLDLHTWEQKVDLCVHYLRGRVHCSAQYARSFIQTAYGRIGETRKYDPKRLKSEPLRSQIVLMRSRNQPTALAPFPRDFGLSEYSKQPVVVYDLDKGHADALQDLRCTANIHRHLDPSLLEAFAQKNLCETYLPSGMKFLDITEQSVYA